MQLAYRQLGQGRPLLILHGLYGSGRTWNAIGKQLSTDYSVYLPDLRNHGDSPWDSDHSYAAMAQDIAEFMQTHALEAPILVGHSMGGKVAMELALTPHTPPLGGLVVVDIAPRAYRSRYHHGILEALCAMHPETLDSRAEADAELEADIPDTLVRQFLITNLVRREEGGFRWKINVQGLYQDLDAILGPVRAGSYPHPALFMRGANSDYVRAEDLPPLYAQFPQAQLVSIPDAGHWVHADQPAVFISQLRQFLGA
jgi:esterase